MYNISGKISSIFAMYNVHFRTTLVLWFFIVCILKMREQNM